MLPPESAGFGVVTTALFIFKLGSFTVIVGEFGEFTTVFGPVTGLV